jgi:hypothetical protein
MIETEQGSDRKGGAVMKAAPMPVGGAEAAATDHEVVDALKGCRHVPELAICQKPTQVLAAEGAKLRGILDANPDIALHLMKRLCFMVDGRLHDCHCAMGTL